MFTARSAETPPALLADADLIVEGPPGVREFLQRLIHGFTEDVQGSRGVFADCDDDIHRRQNRRRNDQ